MQCLGSFALLTPSEKAAVKELSGYPASRSASAADDGWLLEGAGGAGLVAAREAVREGHQVSILEQGPSSQLGGVWVYTDEVESDPSGARLSLRLT